MVKKESFLFAKYPLSPPIQCWNITEQLRAQTLTFWSTVDQGRGEEGKEEVKKTTFPTLLTMIVAFFFSLSYLQASET